MSEPENKDVESFSEKPTEVIVTVKDEKKKTLEQQLEEKTLESEDYKAKLELLADLAFEKRKKELKCEDEKITTPEALEAWNLGRQGEKRVPSGSVPLSPAQRGEPYSNEKEYSTYEEMLKDLHDQERSGNPEERAFSKAVLDELVKRSVRQIIKTGQQISDEDAKKPDFKLERKKKKVE